MTSWVSSTSSMLKSLLPLSREEDAVYTILKHVMYTVGDIRLA